MQNRRSSAQIVMGLASQLERELEFAARNPPTTARPSRSTVSWEQLALAHAHREVLALAEKMERKAAAEAAQKARRRKGVEGLPGRPRRKRKKGEEGWRATSRSEKHVRLDLEK